MVNPKKKKQLLMSSKVGKSKLLSFLTQERKLDREFSHHCRRFTIRVDSKISAQLIERVDAPNTVDLSSSFHLQVIVKNKSKKLSENSS